MSRYSNSIAAVAARLQQHSNRTFDILNDLLLDMYGEDGPDEEHEELYLLLLESEEHLQRSCRRIDEVANILYRRHDKEVGR